MRLHFRLRLASRRARQQFAFALILATSVGVTACSQPAPPPEPAAPAPAPAAPVRLYVSDETRGNIIVIDGVAGTVVQTVAVGKRPRGLHLSHDGTQLLVALSGSPIAGPGVDEDTLPPPDRSADGIGIVDVAKLAVAKVLHTGQDPETFDISLDGKIAYVSNEDAALMTAVDVTTGQIKGRVKVGEEPEGVTVRPDGGVVYVTCEATSEVVVVDLATLKVVATVKTGTRPRSVIFTPDSATAFVTNENDGTVSVMDAKTHTVLSTIKLPTPAGEGVVPPRPMGGVLSPDHSTLYVSLGRAKSVAVIDAVAKTYTRTIENVGLRPWGIAISPDGQSLYTANGPGADVTIVDVKTGTVRARIPTGGSPWGVVVAAQ